MSIDMKRLLSILMIFVAVAMFAADKATTVFTLDHQMSEHCKMKINNNLRFEKGVQKIDVALDKNTITIVYNPEKTDDQRLLQAFKKIGFNAVVVKPAVKEKSDAKKK